MDRRAPVSGFRIKGNRVDERDFEKWLRDLQISPLSGSISPDMLAPATNTFITTSADAAADAAITALKAESNPFSQYATDAEAASLASTAQSAAIAAAAAGLAAHVADPDPHPQYLTAAEGATAYLPVGTTTSGITEGANQYFTGSRARAAARLWSVRAVSANTSASTSDDLITVDASGGSRTVNLPALASNQSMRLFVKKIDSSGNAVVIDPNGTEMIDGASTLSITTQYVSVTLVAGATEWHII